MHVKGFLQKSVMLLMLLSVIGCAKVASEKVVFPVPPDQARLEWIGTYRSQNDFSGGVMTTLTGVGFDEKTGFTGVMGMTGSGDGRVLVCDLSGQTVKVLDLDNKKITSQDPLYTDPVSDNGSIENFNIQEGSPVINAGLSFLQPAFPMAGTGIFENITEYPTTDIFGETLDINHMGPNIGASNVHNSANTLGIHSPQSAQSVFTLYPNPVRDDLNLKLNTNLQKADITIYDLQGRQIYNTSIKEVSNSMKVALPETIRNGIYLIKVSEGQQAQTSQLILYRK